MCTASVHNTTQNSTDNLPSYLRTNIKKLDKGLADGTSKFRSFQFEFKSKYKLSLA